MIDTTFALSSCVTKKNWIKATAEVPQKDCKERKRFSPGTDCWEFSQHMLQHFGNGGFFQNSGRITSVWTQHAIDEYNLKSSLS